MGVYLETPAGLDLRALPTILQYGEAPGGGAWSPLDLGDSLYAWFDAADAATITDAGAGAVSQWADKSGNDRHVTQGTGGNRPTTGTRTINSLNVIDFVRANTTFLGAVVDSLTKPLTIMAVVDGDDTDNGQGIVHFRNAPDDSQQLTLGINGGVTGHWGAGTQSGGATSTAAVNTNPHLLAGQYRASGQNTTLEIDGAADGSGDSGDGVGGQTLWIGKAGEAYDGGLGEVLICVPAITDDDYTAAETYLATKWGITLA